MSRINIFVTYCMWVHYSHKPLDKDPIKSNTEAEITIDIMTSFRTLPTNAQTNV